MKKEENEAVTGTHVIGEVYTGDVSTLNGLSDIENKILNIVKKNKLQSLHSFFYLFPEGGFTGMISLVESHISLHTWPEYKYLTLDVYLCDYSRDNSKTAEVVFAEIAELFSPSRITKQVMKR